MISYVADAHAKCCESTYEMLESFLGICYKLVFSPDFFMLHMYFRMTFVTKTHSDVTIFYGHLLQVSFSQIFRRGLRFLKL